MSGQYTYIYEDIFLFLMLAKNLIGFIYFSSEVASKEGRKKKHKLINFVFLKEVEK